MEQLSFDRLKRCLVFVLVLTLPMGVETAMKKPNRLVHEKSPYLLQHAYNPVDWYPWGAEAFAAAKKLNRPVFLSIGYSTCHWCHVMEEESFEDPKIAALMNDNFISIKVDREERPDLDAIYMTSVQLLTGGGGWPMSVWLTPDKKPFFGGTYFPPEDRYGRPGFSTVLIDLAKRWKDDGQKLVEQSRKITEAINRASRGGLERESAIPDAKLTMDRAFNGMKKNFDEDYGGFRGRQKFPMPVNMEFLLAHYARTGEEKALQMVRFTMENIIKGGIHDQLGGGFSRYATDPQWIQPHFEKMLYDNAQLIGIALSLYQITQDIFFADAARAGLEYVLRDMTHPEGGFYSAEDADSEGKEGEFYLWTMGEVKKVLGDEVAAVFIHRYGLTPDGNFEDPHTGERGKNILVRAASVKNTAKEFGKSREETEKILNAAEKRLFDLRSKRIRPHLDDKVLTGWNGLMISALARASRILNEPKYGDAAVKAAEFVKKNLFDDKKEKLYRRWREGERKIEAHQIDYALYIQGLIDLFETTGEPRWLQFAVRLHEKHNALFTDDKKGGYFMTVPREDLLVRIKDDRDNVIASGNSVAVVNGLKLGSLGGRKDFEKAARRTLNAFGAILTRQPTSVPKMLTGLDFDANTHLQVVVLGPRDRKDTKEMIGTVNRTFVPAVLLIPVDPEKSQTELAKIAEFIGPMTMLDNKATAYVCQNYACKKPTNSAKELKKQLLMDAGK